MKLSESILHEADYIDSTPLDNRKKRNTTIKRLRNYANEVAVYENRLKVWADLYMESKAEIEALRDELSKIVVCIRAGHYATKYNIASMIDALFTGGMNETE